MTQNDNTLQLPQNEEIKLIRGISHVFHKPEILTGKTSSTGKTTEVEDKKGNSYRLDTEEILKGNLQTRGSTTFVLYTPEKYHRRQKSNKNPGPRPGADGITDKSELPEPTHTPAEG